MQKEVSYEILAFAKHQELACRNSSVSLNLQAALLDSAGKDIPGIMQMYFLYGLSVALFLDGR